MFRLPQIVEMTRQRLMVVPGSTRDRVIAERVEVDEPSLFEQIALPVLAIALGLIAAAPTGGASLATAGTVAALATAGFALDAYLAYDAVRDYRIAEAASGTDPDKARALSQADPSLFWLAVELIGAGLGAAAAVKTFGALARARRAALAATGAEEVAKHLDEIKLLTEGAGLSDDVGERLAKQVLDEHVDVAVAARARVAAKGRRAARGQLTDAIPAHPSARLGEPTKAEILALRAQYKLDSDSEAAALWHVLHQRSTRDVVAGEDAIKRVFGIDVKKEGEKMADLLKVDNRGLKVPVEVKNGKRITISGEGNSAIGKFENIAKHADMEGITHFETICNTASKLEPNFKLGRDGTLYRLVSGSHPPEWEQVLIGGKKVYVKAGNLGEISQ